MFLATLRSNSEIFFCTRFFQLSSPSWENPSKQTVALCINNDTSRRLTNTDKSIFLFIYLFIYFFSSFFWCDTAILLVAQIPGDVAHNPKKTNIHFFKFF